MPASPRQIAEHEAKLGRFAELLSRGMEVPVIAQAMGITRGNASALLAKLRDKFGAQAR